MGMLAYLILQTTMVSGAAVPDTTAECNPDSPIYVEQSSVKLFHVHGSEDTAETQSFSALAGLLGDPVLRITNTTKEPLTVNVDLSGDPGFFIDNSMKMPSENTTNHSQAVPGLSTVVVPLVYQPDASFPEDENDQFQSASGIATVSAAESPEYADMIIETYLVGFAIAFPDYSGDMDDEIEGDDGKESDSESPTP